MFAAERYLREMEKQYTLMEGYGSEDSCIYSTTKKGGSLENNLQNKENVEWTLYVIQPTFKKDPHYK